LRLADILLEVLQFKHLIVKRIGIGRAIGFPPDAVYFGAQKSAIMIKAHWPNISNVLGMVD